MSGIGHTSQGCPALRAHDVVKINTSGVGTQQLHGLVESAWHEFRELNRFADASGEVVHRAEVAVAFCELSILAQDKPHRRDRQSRQRGIGETDERGSERNRSHRSAHGSDH